MTGEELALASLAAYRLTRLVTTDTILDAPRRAWWRRHPPDTKLGELVGCDYCAGWWVSGLVLAVAAACGFAPRRWRTVSLWPAVAGGQALLSAIDDRLGR